MKTQFHYPGRHPVPERVSNIKFYVPKCIMADLFYKGGRRSAIELRETPLIPNLRHELIKLTSSHRN